MTRSTPVNVRRVDRPVVGGAVTSCLVLFLLAFAARAGWGLVGGAGKSGASALVFPDERQYWAMGQGLRAGQGLRDELGFRATRMPLYPGYLSLFPDSPGGLRAALLGQWFVGAMAAPLAALVASALLGGTLIRWVAGVLIALDPFLVYFSSLVLTETFFVTVLAFVWHLAARRIRVHGGTYPAIRGWVSLGVASALAVYVRESAFGLIVLLFAWTVATTRRRADALGAALALGILALGLWPWALRNDRVLGSWRWLTTRGGISLYDGVRVGATGASDLGDVKAATDVAQLDELAWDQWFLRRSWEEIRRDPARIARLAVVKLSRMWSLTPNAVAADSAAVRCISALWTAPTFGLAATGWVLLVFAGPWRDRGAATLLMLPAIYFSALHALFVGSVRYRLGVLPMLAVLAAIGVRAWTERRKRDAGAPAG